MTQSVPLMTDPELSRINPTGGDSDDDRCFGSLSTARGHLPLAAMDVSARIDGLVASVELRQTFVNTIDEAIEATYIFPLPDRAAVTRFRMKVGDRIIDGVIKERGEARQIYDAAISEGKRAAITEEERPGVFTMRVGNLMPGDRAEVMLSMTGPLPLVEGDATFRFPLVVAPRYIPGTPLGGDDVGLGVASDTDAVPDASRITPPVLLPGYPNPVRLSMQVDIDSGGLPLADLRSSLHAVSETGDGSRRRITLAAGERLNRDFILRFSVGADTVTSGLVLSPDEAGDEGTFLLTLVPPTVLSKAQKPRDVVFVLDRSGSMGGWKMVAARRAVARMVDTLSDADRFGVIAFDNVIETPPRLVGEGLAQATDRNRFRAVEFLAGIEARGGTEMARPLERAADLLAGGYADRERVLVLVTDGQVGNEDQILRSLAARLKNVRTFTLGIDRAVNLAFLRRLADLGGGSCELVESEDRLDDVMDAIHRRIGTPVVTEIALEPSGLEWTAGSVVPGRLPDLFAGSPVTIQGRYRGAGAGSITVAGHLADGSQWRQTVTGHIADNPAVARLWARARVRQLEDEYVIGRGDRTGLEKQIVDTSLRFSVLCRFTAFVAVDEAERVNPGGDLREVVQPVDMPDGWAMPGAQAMPSMAPVGDMRYSMASPAPAPAAAPGSAGAGYGRGGVGGGRSRKAAKKVAGLFSRAAKSESLDELGDAFAPDLGGSAPDLGDLEAEETAEEKAAPGYPERLERIAARLEATGDLDSAIADLSAIAAEMERAKDRKAKLVRALIARLEAMRVGEPAAAARTGAAEIRELASGKTRSRLAFWKR